MSDGVTKPLHYNAGQIECIDAIESALGPDGFVAYCRGNVLKYTWRAPYKNGEEDLKKAAVYAGWAKAGTAQGRLAARLRTGDHPIDITIPHTPGEARAAEQLDTALAEPALNHAGGVVAE